MAKTEKKLSTGVNTEIDQALAAINFTEFTAIDRPPSGRWGRKISYLLFLLVLLAAGLAYFFRFGKNLTDLLPADTWLYVSLSLPAENQWFTPLLFWSAESADGQSSQKLASVYSRLNLISWDQVRFAENLLPLFSGQIELARLAPPAGSDRGAVLFKTELRDQGAWLSLFGLGINDYHGEVVSRDLALSGWWVVLTKNPNKIAWRILGNDLYITDDESVLGDLANKKSEALAKQLKNMKVKPALATIYARDRDSLPKDNPYGQALAAANVWPAAITLKQAKQAINFVVTGQNQTKQDGLGGDLAWKLLANNNAFYAQDLRSAYEYWQTYAPSDLSNNLRLIGRDFYGVDIDALLTEIGPAEILLTFSGSDWLFNIASKDRAVDPDLLASLKKIGQAMFAVTHPQVREQKLADGSKMTELRADHAGDWQDEPWSWAGQAVTLQLLKGQGELNGYYVAFVPTIGYIFTTALPLLNQYVQLDKPGLSVVQDTGCAVPDHMALGASLSPTWLNESMFWPIRVQKILITVLRPDKMAGCVVLGD